MNALGARLTEDELQEYSGGTMNALGARLTEDELQECPHIYIQYHL